MAVFAIVPVAAHPQDKPQTADDVYTSLKRFIDYTEGHPPIADEVNAVKTPMNVGYMLGMLDGLMMSAIAHSSSTECARNPISTIMLARNFISYVDSHPGERGSDYQGVAYHSIVNAYPCLSPLKKT